MYNPPALPQPVIPVLDHLARDLYLSPPLPPPRRSPPRPSMAPYIIELSSDEGEPLPSPPRKKRRRPTSACSPSSSSSPLPPLPPPAPNHNNNNHHHHPHLSSPMPPKSQKSITSFFSPSGIKKEQLTLPQIFPAKRTIYFDRPQNLVTIDEGELLADNAEAPLPEPFDAPTTPRPIEIEDEWEKFTPGPEETKQQSSSSPARSSRRRRNPPAPKRKFQAIQSPPSSSGSGAKRRLAFAAVPAVYSNRSTVKDSPASTPRDSPASRFRAVRTVKVVETTPAAETETPPATEVAALVRVKLVGDSQSTPIARETFGMPYTERVAAYARAATIRPILPHLPPLASSPEPPRAEDDDELMVEPPELYEEDDFPHEDPFPKGSARVNALGQVICTLHGDPECSSEDCIHEFFENYCPMKDTEIGDLVYPEYVAHAKRNKAPEEGEEVLHPPLRKTAVIAVLIAGGAEGMRLPYMSLEMREFIKRHAAILMADFKKCDGELLHVPFSATEILKLAPAVREYAAQNYVHPPPSNANPTPKQITNDLFCLLTHTFSRQNDTKASIERFLQTSGFSLPGRGKGDIQRFIWDAYNDEPRLEDPSLMVRLNKPLAIRSLRGLGRELGVRDLDPLLSMKARHNHVMANLRPVWKFNGGASDIHDIRWTPSGDRFAMSTPCTSDEYNRPGNLMLGYTEPPSVRMLYRHALRVRPTNVGNFEKYEYTTVPSIRFSNDGSMLHSCGHDGSMKTWSKDGKWLGEVNFDDNIVIMETSLVGRLLAVGRSKGLVSVIQLNEHGVHTALTTLNAVDRGVNKNKLYPSAMAWGGTRFENILVVGYDNEKDEGNKSGGLAIWDVERGVNIFKSYGNVRNPYRHFDVYMGEGKFVTGSLRSGRSTSGSVVKLWDLHNMQTILECVSTQDDVNCVRISPCERFLSSSGTTNNTLIWDVRNTSGALYDLQHGATAMPTSAETNLAKDDTGVTFIEWSPFNSTVFTGGSDGCIKQWDLTRADPFVVDVATVESQVMAAAFSPSWDSLIVGEASGRATLFSVAAHEGDAVPEIVTNWNEDRNWMNPNDDGMRWSSWSGRRPGATSTSSTAAAAGGGGGNTEEQEESGVLLSRAMILSGLMQRDPENPRYVWATPRYYDRQRKEERKGGRGG